MAPDLLDIRCPQCGRLYQIPAHQVGSGSRKVRCTACGTIFSFSLESPPLDLDLNRTVMGSRVSPDLHKTIVENRPPAPKGNGRTHARESVHARAIFRLLPSGLELHGATQDISASGVMFLTNNPPSDEKALKVGISGIFELILLEGKQPAFIEMLAKVVRIVEDGFGLHFFPDSPQPQQQNLSLPMSPFTPRPYAKVFVRRSNGMLENGWQILPANTILPPTIAKLYQERKHQTLTVVCRKKSQAGEGFKIYSVKELREIQMEAENLGFAS